MTLSYLPSARSLAALALTTLFFLMFSIITPTIAADAATAISAPGTTPGTIYAPALALSSEQADYLLLIALAIALIGFALAEPNSARALYERLRRAPRARATGEARIRA